MKKLIPLVLALCMLIAPISADEQGMNTAPSLPEETANPEVVFLAGSVPADATLMDAIGLPIHALVLSMTEHEFAYDPQSAPFVWNALYYALSMYGEADDRAELTQDALLLPSESVDDFFRALFAGLDTLPALPEQMDGFVSYHSNSDMYRLALGDFALTQIRLGQLMAQENGTFTVDGTLTSPEDSAPLSSFRVTLTENDTMFGFSILDVSLF